MTPSEPHLPADPTEEVAPPTEEAAPPTEEVTDAVGVTHAEVPDTGWRMLHSASVLVNLLPRTWSFVRSAWPLLLVVVVRGEGVDATRIVDLSLLSFFLMMTVGSTLVHFLTLRWRVTGGTLEIKSGLLNRQERVISPRRVQNVELVRNLFHRLSGLVELRIETASGSDVEGLLSALSTDDANLLLRTLRRNPASKDAGPVGPALVQNSPFDLLRYGATGTRFGAALVALGILYEASIALDPARATDTAWTLGRAGAVALGVTLVVGTWLSGMASALMRHYGFTLRKSDGQLIAEEGLFTRRRVELPLRKVQVVAVVEPWLRRIAGIATVVIETATARAGQGGVQRALTLVPVIQPSEVDALVSQAMPGIHGGLSQIRLRPPHPKALRRFLARAVGRSVLFTGFALWWWGPWGGLAALSLPWFGALAWLDHRHQAWAITDDVVVSRRGWLRRSTTVVERARLQSLELDQGPILWRWGLAQVVLRVAGTSVVMPLLSYEDAFGIVTRLSQEAGRPASARGGAAPTCPETPAAL